MRRNVFLATIWLALPLTAAPSSEESDVFRAIRNGDRERLTSHLTKESANAKDARGATPLMHAAAFGNLPTMKLLLQKGADVNARNAFNATALLWCARDPEKARLLIENAADVNAQSKQGRTPLMVAASKYGNAPIVALLLSKGADAIVKTARGETALGSAGKSGDAEIIRLLLAKGADPNQRDFLGRTPLFMASGSGHAEGLAPLIQAGANVNASNSPPAPGAAPPTVNMEKNGPPNNTRVSPLHNAVAFGPVASVRILLKAGADVNARDSRGLTPLVFALASETPSLETVHALIQAGANVNAADSNGETPLDWASKFAYPEVIAELKKAGAKSDVAYAPPKLPKASRPEPRVAVERSIRLLEKTSAQFFQNSGCAGCHHQMVISRAQAAAKAIGIPIDQAGSKDVLQQLRTAIFSLQEEFLQGIVPGGGANRIAENLQGLYAGGYAADSMTDSAVFDIANAQEPDGHWSAGDVQLRPPIAQSPFAGTTRAIRVLQDYGLPARKQEFVQRVERGRAWLLQNQPITTEDYAMKLSGLTCSGAAKPHLAKAAKAVLALQRPDGGWGGNKYMASDAYATAGALIALAESKAIPVTDPAYRKGLDYLLSTQFPDGSWHVRSRAIKFQPYFESGFPFGHDQWISTAATAFAAQAVALSIQSPPFSAQTR